MTQKLFADLVYNNFLFDIPRMMDLCTLYNVPDNQPLLTKMISSLFSCQPRFFDDLSIAAQTISQVGEIVFLIIDIFILLTIVYMLKLF